MATRDSIFNWFDADSAQSDYEPKPTNALADLFTGTGKFRFRTDFRLNPLAKGQVISEGQHAC